jgi:hypothetical protein
MLIGEANQTRVFNRSAISGLSLSLEIQKSAIWSLRRRFLAKLSKAVYLDAFNPTGSSGFVMAA